MTKEESEKRKYARFSYVKSTNYEISIPINLRSTKEGQGMGEIQDVSKGGISMLTDKSLGKFQVVKVDFPIPETNVAIPTLVEVRWSTENGEEYLSGMRFLLSV